MRYNSIRRQYTRHEESPSSTTLQTLKDAKVPPGGAFAYAFTISCLPPPYSPKHFSSSLDEPRLPSHPNAREALLLT
jgi:hypothetical protein